MTLLSVDELRTFVTSTLDDAPLATLLEAAEEAIDLFIGPLWGVTSGDQGQAQELISVHGDLLRLSTPAESIATVLEGRFSPTTLETDDYELRPGGRLVRRLDTGTNPATHWRGRVDITYTPLSIVALRKLTQVELVKLDIAFNPALASQTIGSWSETYTAAGGRTYGEQRADILAALSPSPVGIY